MSPSDAISPTAHYTGYVWYRNGLSHPALAGLRGRVLFESLQPANRVSGVLGGPTLEGYLLARHEAIDTLLTRAIERDGITQVLELACGLSPRGWRFAQRYGDRISYLEADLPAMADRKRRALDAIGSLSDCHRVVAVDALRDEGEGSLAAIAQGLDRERGLVVITEGLLNYLPGDAVEGLWGRLAGLLSGFASGRYLSDLQVGETESPPVAVFRLLLSAFVRGRVHLHFGDAREAQAALVAAGFESAEVVKAATVVALAGQDGTAAARAGGSLAHIIEASTR